jgi:prepilin-type N-terminal cleavage/methylation domain-containing protein
MTASVRARRGYTLVELAAASAAFAVIVVLLLQWFGGLLSSVAANNDIASAQRQYLVAAQQLREDVAAAESCLPYGQDTPLARLDAGVLVLRHGPDRAAVAWREQQGRLERAELDPCADDAAEADWAAVLSVVEGSATFSVRDRDGVAHSELGVCDATLFGGCDPSSVVVSFEQVGRTGTAQARLVVASR